MQPASLVAAKTLRTNAATSPRGPFKVSGERQTRSLSGSRPASSGANSQEAHQVELRRGRKREKAAIELRWLLLLLFCVNPVGRLHVVSVPLNWHAFCICFCVQNHLLSLFAARFSGRQILSSAHNIRPASK